MYDVEKYGHLDKGIIGEVGCVYIDEEGKVLRVDGWVFLYAKIGHFINQNGDDVVCGYTKDDLLAIARLHGKVLTIGKR